MARLWVTDVDAVQQQDNLVLRTSAYRDVGLGANRSPLSHIHAYSVFKQIVNTLYWRLRNILAIQYSYHSRSLTLGQWRPRSSHADFIEHHLASCRGRNGVGNHWFRAHAFGRCVCECGYRKHTAYYLAAQTAEERVAFVSEMTENQALALHVECWFVHN